MSSQPGQLLTLQCPSCGARAAYYAGDPSIKCAYCGNEHIFNLPVGPAIPSPILRGEGNADLPSSAYQDALGAGQLAAPARPLPRPRFTRPNSVTLEQENGGLKLTRRWASWKAIPLAFFVVVWDGFLCFWYGMGLMTSAPAIMFIFPVLHVAAGVFLTYTLLATLLNRTTIRVSREWFAVQHDPVPWTGELKVPVRDLEQLYCQQKISRGKNSTSVTYTLVALLKDGTRKNLLTGLESPDVAGFIEQTVENLLNITDRRVTGEMALGEM